MDISDPKVITAITVAASGIVGAAIGAYSKAVSSKQKINELKENYNQKLQDTYLENARKYTESVYVPLSISLSNLGYMFQSFRAQTNDNDKTDAKDKFDSVISEFLATMTELSSRGANAFLTAELDEKLLAFCSFLSESKSVDFPAIKMIVGFSLPFLGSGYKDEVEKRISGKYARRLWSPKLSLSVGGFGVSYEAKEILAAPLDSKDFEERFVRDYHLINVLIKEVTLGAKAKHNL